MFCRIFQRQIPQVIESPPSQKFSDQSFKKRICFSFSAGIMAPFDQARGLRQDRNQNKKCAKNTKAQNLDIILHTLISI